MERKFSTRMLAEAGVMIALATVLSFIKVITLPQGGSVTAGAMIPIIIFSIRWGWKNGLMAAIVFGSLQAMLGGYIVHPVQLILDYPLAFGVLGLAGLGTKTQNTGIMSIGIVLGLGLRYISHVASGIVFFGEYAPEGQSAFYYSVTYNASYYGPELVVTIVLAVLLGNTAKKQIFKKQII